MNLSSFQDFWKSLSTGQKLAAGGAVVGLIAVVSAVMFWAGKPKMELLYGGLSDEDMAKVVSVVEASGTKFKTTETGNGVRVLKEDVHRLRMTLAEQGLPSDSTVGMELFGNNPGKLGVSDFEQRLNKTRAIQGELSRTIMSLEGVKNARVLIVEPDTRLIKTDPNEKAKASVFIDTGHITLEDKAVNGIRYLVANAVPSVVVQDVAVVDNHGNTLTEKFQEDGMFGEASGSARFLRKLESDYAKKVESMLETVLGAGTVVARVAVELDMDSVTTVDQDFDQYDDGSIAKKEMHDADSLNTRERALGDPGVGQNQNEPQNLPGSVNDLPIAQTEEERESTTTEYIVDSLLTETVKKPGGIKYVTASVFVSNVDFQGNPITNDLTQLNRIVANAIGLKLDATGKGYVNGSVEIAERAFDRPPAFSATFGDKWNNTLDEYAPLVNLIIGLLIAAGVLILFFMIMRKFRAEDQPEVEIIDDSQNGETTAALMDGDYNADGASVPALADALTPELLNELIRDRSENVGSALRSWVNKK